MVVYDPYAAELRHNPYPVYRQLRDEAPLYYNEEHDFYAVSRYDDVLAMLADFPTWTSTKGPNIERRPPLPMLVMYDPPKHTAHRKLMSRLFTPRTVADLEGFIRTSARQLLDPLVGREDFDLFYEFALLLPVNVISALIDLPSEYRQLAMDVSEAATVMKPREQETDVVRVMGDFITYLVDVVAERRKRPGDDVISHLIQAEVEDEQGRHRLDDQQLAYYFWELTFAGHETTAKMIANGSIALDWYPDQRRELVDDPSLIPNAVEEMLRWDTVSHYVARCSTRAVELYGEVIPEGSTVAALLASGNHDERHFEEPELFDIHRKIDRHLSFGFGPHVCLGAALARLELRVAFEELLLRFPRYSIDHSQVRRNQSAQVRGVAPVPVHVTSAR